MTPVSKDTSSLNGPAPTLVEAATIALYCVLDCRFKNWCVSDLVVTSLLRPVSMLVSLMVYDLMTPFWCSVAGGDHVRLAPCVQVVTTCRLRGEPLGALGKNNGADLRKYLFSRKDYLDGTHYIDKQSASSHKH